MTGQVALAEKLETDRMFEEFLCAEAGATDFTFLKNEEDIAGVRVMVRRGFRYGMSLGLEANIDGLETQECAKGLAQRKMYRTAMRDQVAADMIRLAISCGQQIIEKAENG